MPGHFIGIGSNVGAAVNVPEAVRALQSISSSVALSRVFRTTPEGMQSEAMFLNAVAFVQTELCGTALKLHLNRVEGRMGRDRSDPQRGVKDRSIDLDILLSLPPETAEISAEQLPAEPYYRPQMLELIHGLGFACAVPPGAGGEAIELDFARGAPGVQHLAAVADRP